MCHSSKKRLVPNCHDTRASCGKDLLERRDRKAEHFIDVVLRRSAIGGVPAQRSSALLGGAAACSSRKRGSPARRAARMTQASLVGQISTLIGVIRVAAPVIQTVAVHPAVTEMLTVSKMRTHGAASESRAGAAEMPAAKMAAAEAAYVASAEGAAD